MLKVATKPRMSFYNFDKLMSYNGIWNFLCGARGLGKTYGAKQRAVRNNIKNGEQFIYMRRYKEELKKSKDAFFADLEAENAFPEWDFRIFGDKGQKAHVNTRDDKKRHWETIGYFIPLSSAQGVKSVAYPLVTTIIFDEFILEKGLTHYLPNEAEIFINFYSTVDRYKDKTKVFFLANAVSINNPYFLKFKIVPDQVGEFHRVEDGFIVCHFADSADFQNEVYKTRFGRFIQNTEYADYAVGSEFKDNHDGLVEEKTSDAKYFYTLETETGVFSVWLDWDKMIYYIQSKRPKQENVYTLVAGKLDEGKTLLFTNDKLIANLRTYFRNAKMFFDSAQTRNIFIDIFRR